MSKTSPVECKAINGKKAQLAVLKLVKRIYKAFEQKNYKQLKRLQKTLAQSWSLHLLVGKKLHHSKLKPQSLKAIFDHIQAIPQYVLKINWHLEQNLWRGILPILLDVALLKIKQLIVVKSGQEIAIFSQEIALLKQCQQTLIDWLNIWGIRSIYSEISPTHTFDLAGFNIRQSPGSDRVKTRIRPSSVTILNHYRALANCCDQLKGAKQMELIYRLNLIIQKWRSDYLSWCCQKLLQKLDYLLVRKLRQWAIRRHPRKGQEWVINKYWHSVNGDKWRFSAGEISLAKHSARRSQLKKYFCEKVNSHKLPYTEEPYEVKVSSTVLEPSIEGDRYV